MPRGPVFFLPFTIALAWASSTVAQSAVAQGAKPAPSNAPTAAARTRPSPAPRVVDAVATLGDWVKSIGGTASVRVSEADTGSVWAELEPTLPLNPASNMKVLTAATTLARLGSEYRFSTGLYGEIDAGKVDPLVLRGQGDPSLATADLWSLARALRNLGVSQVGNIQVDQSRFDDQFVPPAFEQQPNEWAGFRAPVSAIALERNAVTLHVLPTRAGQAARAWFDPPGVVSIDGSIETQRPGSREAIQLSMEPRPDALVGHIGGHVAEGLPRMRFDRRMDDPRRAPGLALASILADAGVRVQGTVALGGESVKQRLVFHESEPLSQLLVELGKNSDNFYAEMLFKALGGEMGTAPAKSQDGARAVLAWLGELGLAAADLRIENGSGLFDSNRVSAKTLTGVLEAVYRNPALYPEFLAQLAIGGVDGTLRNRFRKLSPKRSVRAKTGTLSAAIALSGYALASNGKAPITFSFLINQIEGHAGEARQKIDQVVEAIVRSRAEK
ncbi:MAG TPA: D-alanyl-D-alanine carboxypeptidase/D-alanyl-D-alanine-endopeptidase [Polyangiaceae bacterium]|nr:D-alanyl-D-alanine carboxypeptidase/D-alanyl-D-alanine-endopeptidase [Polyangiaceae bacterium]